MSCDSPTIAQVERVISESMDVGILANCRGIHYLRYTKPQRAFMSDTRPVVLWRDGNQLGKSTSLAADLVHRCRGTHPFQQTKRPPIKALIMGVSLEQMDSLMRRIWELIPRHELDPRNDYDPGRGITGKPPRLLFVSGPGKGSVINFATYKQSSQRIAGATLDLVLLDEPPPEGVFGEVLPRVLRNRGHIRIGMTPTPDMPNQTWLREKVEGTEKQPPSVFEHNFGLCAENCWPEGDPFPWLRQPEIDEYEAALLSIEREMRMRGAWDPVVTGRLLEGFTEDNLRDEDPPGDVTLVHGIGIDHGATAGKQAAMLVTFADHRTERPRVWYRDEYIPSELTTVEEDAAGILDMIERNGLVYRDIELWIGDRVSRATRRDVEKSNALINQEMAYLLKQRAAENGEKKAPRLSPIITPRKKRGSVLAGVRLMNTLFMRRDAYHRPSATVHSRCTRFIEACMKFAGDSQDPLKDILDAGRYVTELALQGTRVKFESRASRAKKAAGETAE